MEKHMSFDSEVVIVTGAGSGIGAAAARRFSAEGATVVLADWSRESADEVSAGLPPDRTLAR